MRVRLGSVLQRLSAAPGVVSWWSLGEDHDTVRVQIFRLRKQLGAGSIARVRGVGYELTAAGREAMERR